MREAVQPLEELATEHKGFVIAEGARPTRVRIVLHGDAE